MDYGKEFQKYATKHKGISSLHLNEFSSIHGNYISPTIIEERQMNVASMDVFSRLMMDRIIFLGVPINDYVANIIQAQLLFFESVDATIWSKILDLIACLIVKYISGLPLINLAFLFFTPREPALMLIVHNIEFIIFLILILFD